MIIRGYDLAIAVELLHESPIALCIARQVFWCLSRTLTEVLIDKFVSEAEVLEEKITDLLVGKIALQAMLHALEVGDGPHFSTYLLFRADLSISNQLSLQHLLDGIALKPSHLIEGRLEFVRFRGLKCRAGRRKDSARTASIGEDALGYTSIEVIGVEVDSRRVSFLRWQFHQVKLVISFAHLRLPVLVLMIAIIKQESVVEQFRQDALRR